jgi:hypothetical protein
MYIGNVLGVATKFLLNKSEKFKSRSSGLWCRLVLWTPKTTVSYHDTTRRHWKPQISQKWKIILQTGVRIFSIYCRCAYLSTGTSPLPHIFQIRSLRFSYATGLIFIYHCLSLVFKFLQSHVMDVAVGTPASHSQTWARRWSCPEVFVVLLGPSCPC